MSPILGITVDESKLRLNNYLRRGGCNVFSEKKNSSHPLSIWTEADIWGYIRKYGIEYADIYNKNVARTGCMCCGFGCTRKGDSRFKILYELYPRIYEMCMSYTNHGITYREALQACGVFLPEFDLF